ncbi:MAG: hypothetical protein KDK70_12865 [Myxococcales bacterium]|nr:hypothetical protein [Myxococcales bacterium]
MIETEQGEHERLVNELARVFHEPEEARHLAVSAGLAQESIPAFKLPSVFWAKVVEHARNGGLQGGTERIRAMARKKLPQNPVFAPRHHEPLLYPVVREPPRPSLLSPTGGALFIGLGMLLMATLVLGWDYIDSTHEPDRDEDPVGTLEHDDEPSGADEADSSSVPSPDAGSMRWTCVSFRSKHAHSATGRMTTCRAAKARCLSIKEHQSRQGAQPSECVAVMGEHPADAFDTPRARWPRSDSHKQGIDGWLYPYGDLVSPQRRTLPSLTDLPGPIP